jgi:hypothetical protein
VSRGDQSNRRQQECEVSRVPHFVDNQLTDAAESVSLTRPPTAFYPQEDSSWVDNRAIVRLEGLSQLKKSNALSDLPASGIVSQRTTLPRAPYTSKYAVRKGEVFPMPNRAQHYEDVWGGWGILPGILNLGTRCRWEANLMFRPLNTRGETALVPTGQDLGWAPKQVSPRYWITDRGSCRESTPACSHRVQSLYPVTSTLGIYVTTS